MKTMTIDTEAAKTEGREYHGFRSREASPYQVAADIRALLDRHFYTLFNERIRAPFGGAPRDLKELHYEVLLYPYTRGDRSLVVLARGRNQYKRLLDECTFLSDYSYTPDTEAGMTLPASESLMRRQAWEKAVQHSAPLGFSNPSLPEALQQVQLYSPGID